MFSTKNENKRIFVYEVSINYDWILFYTERNVGFLKIKKEKNKFGRMPINGTYFKDLNLDNFEPVLWWLLILSCER